MPKLSNELLLTLYKKADAKAFDEFFRRNHRLVFGYLLCTLRHRQDAERALAATFSRMHHSILAFDTERNALGWTFEIARRVMIETEQRRRRAKLSPGSPDFGMLGEVELTEAREELERLVSTLSREDRELLRARYLDVDLQGRGSSRPRPTGDKGLASFARIMRRVRST